MTANSAFAGQRLGLRSLRGLVPTSPIGKQPCQCRQSPWYPSRRDSRGRLGLRYLFKQHIREQHIRDEGHPDLSCCRRDHRANFIEVCTASAKPARGQQLVLFSTHRGYLESGVRLQFPRLVLHALRRYTRIPTLMPLAEETGFPGFHVASLNNIHVARITSTIARRCRTGLCNNSDTKV